MVTKFDNPVVAAKAWNMLFSLSDWATSLNSRRPTDQERFSWRQLWQQLSHGATYRRSKRHFVPSRLDSRDPKFQDHEVVLAAREFLDSWQRGRWALVAKYMPPVLRGSRTEGQLALHTRDLFEPLKIQAWRLLAVEFDQVSSAVVRTTVTVEGEARAAVFRMIYWLDDERVGVPEEQDGHWSLAVWAPATYFDGDDLALGS
jgi:hypothetical protein